MSSSRRTVLPYGGWPSTISARSLVAGVVSVSALTARDGTLYWLEGRPEEGGRTVLVRQDADGSRDLTPAPHNVRSRVHEYGGGAYAVGAQDVWIVDFADQNLYRIDGSGTITQLTRTDAGTRFADFVVDARRNRLITVVEQHGADEPENYLGAVDLDSGALTRLTAGRDFYAAPRLSPDGSTLAFIAWDHPNMPWDGTELVTTTLDDAGAVGRLVTVAGGAEESVLQPLWLRDGVLLFISDRAGWWNLYRFDDSGTFCVLEDAADYAEPAWQFGMRSCTPAGGDHVLIVRQGERGQEVALVDTASTMGSPFLGDDQPWLGYGSPCVAGADFCFIGTRADRSPAIERVPLAGGPATTVRRAGGPEIDPADLSLGEPLTFPTRDGHAAHAYFYRPMSARFEGPEGERPPLVVMTHGGPTAAVHSDLNLRIQYYTTRGWAVVYVNYRGSSSYGRAYRTALNGRWGEIDVTDCEDVVRFLSRSGKIDPERVAIRGGSAGGFTTLAALTRSDVFRAGASHYGIGDLAALARDTHKFESRYLDGLLGSEEAIHERSPIHHLDGFHCPVIFFQGSEDRVVPPNQSQAMAAALRDKGIPVAYLEFAGEGHGFRDAGNIVLSVESEYGFFCRVFAIDPADELPDIPIDNAGRLTGRPTGDRIS
ncbi:MAG: prolyl oligopeptidase family serine peptidase [Pseudomonadales bacterium]